MAEVSSMNESDSSMNPSALHLNNCNFVADSTDDVPADVDAIVSSTVDATGLTEESIPDEGEYDNDRLCDPFNDDVAACSSTSGISNKTTTYNEDMQPSEKVCEISCEQAESCVEALACREHVTIPENGDEPEQSQSTCVMQSKSIERDAYNQTNQPQTSNLNLGCTAITAEISSNNEELELETKFTKELEQAKKTVAKANAEVQEISAHTSNVGSVTNDFWRTGSGTSISNIAAQLADRRIRGGVSVTVSPLERREPGAAPLVGSQRRKKGHAITSAPLASSSRPLPQPYTNNIANTGLPPVVLQSLLQHSVPQAPQPQFYRGPPPPPPNAFVSSPNIIGALQGPRRLSAPPQTPASEPLQNGHAKVTPNGMRVMLSDTQKEAWSMLLGEVSEVTSTPISLPPPHLGIDIPQGGYKCPGKCGQSFALKSSLEFHLARKIFNANAHCKLCQYSRPISFYNKCTFWKHVKSHSDVKPGADPRSIFFELCMQSIQGVAVDHAFDSWLCTPSFARLAHISSLDNYEFAAQKNAPTKRIDNESSREMSGCSECGEKMLKESLRGHFVHNTPTAQKQFICTQCSAVFFSSCSFHAHRRTKHEATKSPYTCPECGMIEANAQALHQHQLDHRTRPTVLEAWRCPKCTTFYSNRTTLIVHYTTAHCVYSHKCSLCNVVLEQASHLEDHRRKEHHFQDARLVSIPGPCPLCPAHSTNGLIPNKELMIEHIKDHLKSTPAFCVFRCPVCGRLMENKHGLSAHYAKVHGLDVYSSSIDDTPFPINGDSSQSNSPSPSITHPTTNQPSPKKMRLDSAVCPTNSGDTIKCQKYLCGFVTTDIDSMRQHAMSTHKDSDNRHHLCLDCGLSFYTDISLKRHLIALHKVSDGDEYFRRYPGCAPLSGREICQCDVCGRRFDSRPALLAHKRTHGVAFLNSLQKVDNVMPAKDIRN